MFTYYRKNCLSPSSPRFEKNFSIYLIYNYLVNFFKNKKVFFIYVLYGLKVYKFAKSLTSIYFCMYAVTDFLRTFTDYWLKSRTKNTPLLVREIAVSPS